jgi:uncharacterized metal-binding protein YceD (DUF177 family)
MPRGLRHVLRIKSRLQLVGPGEEWPDEDLADDSADAIEAEKELAVLSLVEDEVLLALPIAPRTKRARRLRRTRQGMDHRRLRRWPL